MEDTMEKSTSKYYPNFNSERFADEEIGYLVKTIPHTPVNPDLVQEALQDDYFKQLEDKWKASLPKLTDIQLVEIYRKEEIIDLCIKKIKDLKFHYDCSKLQYKKKADYIQFRKFNEVANYFWTLYLDCTIGERIKTLYEQINRLSHLYLLASDKLPHFKNRITEEQLNNARSYPTYQLYQGRLRKTGRRFTALCCFHEERTPSLVFYENGSFHCFGCQAHGNNAIDFLMKLRNVSFKEAMGELI